MKDKKTLNAKKSETPKMPDLRHSVDGSLQINAVDAGQSEQGSESDLKVASPDFEVPAGQVTHE